MIHILRYGNDTLLNGLNEEEVRTLLQKEEEEEEVRTYVVSYLLCLIIDGHQFLNSISFQFL